MENALSLGNMDGVLVKKKSTAGKVVKVILLCLIGIGAVVGIALLVKKYLDKKKATYDLYDDLDNYYDESDDCEVYGEDFVD